MASVNGFVSGQKNQWPGNMVRRSEDDTSRAVPPNRQPMGKRTRGRSGKRWLDVVEEDLDRIGVQEWRGTVQDREKWREIALAAKTLGEY